MTRQLPDKFLQKMYDKSRTRRLEILNASLVAAREVGYTRVTSTQISVLAGCSHGTIFSHFKDMENLRRALMQHAVDCGDAEVVLQGLVTRSHIALRAPEELRQRALTILNNELN